MMPRSFLAYDKAAQARGDALGFAIQMDEAVGFGEQILVGEGAAFGRFLRTVLTCAIDCDPGTND